MFLEADGKREGILHGILSEGTKLRHPRRLDTEGSVPCSSDSKAVLGWKS